MQWPEQRRLRTYLEERGFSHEEASYGVGLVDFIRTGELPRRPFPSRWKLVASELPHWVERR